MFASTEGGYADQLPKGTTPELAISNAGTWPGRAVSLAEGSDHIPRIDVLTNQVVRGLFCNDLLNFGDVFDAGLPLVLRADQLDLSRSPRIVLRWRASLLQLAARWRSRAFGTVIAVVPLRDCEARSRNSTGKLARRFLIDIPRLFVVHHLGWDAILPALGTEKIVLRALNGDTEDPEPILILAGDVSFCMGE